MNTERLMIKNMVCGRCITVVKQIVEGLRLPYSSIEMGEVELKLKLNAKQTQALRSELEKNGFEWIDDRQSVLIKKIKQYLIQRARLEIPEKERNLNLSDWLRTKMLYDYSYLSNLFSTVEGITIEKFYHAQKVERVKELIVYKQLNLSEIAEQMGYSSSAHLSKQFKQYTGLTPSHFKKVGMDKRKAIDLL